MFTDFVAEDTQFALDFGLESAFPGAYGVACRSMLTVLLKLIYKPFGLMLGILAGLLGKKAFDFVWTKLDDEEPPEATTELARWRRVLAAAAVQGVIFRVTRVAVDRYGAIGWRYLTGTWPGERRPDPDD